MTASATLALLLRVARAELRAFEGRFGMAWRVAAQCMLATAVFMTYGIPLAAIGCYLVLFIMKPDSTETSLMAVAILVLVSVVVLVMFPLLHLTIDSPVLRMGVLVGSSLLFLYIGAASQLGPVGNILALVVAFIMTLLSDVPFGEVATRGLLYAWLMAATPMGVVIVFNMFFGRSALAWVRATLAARLQAAAQVLAGAEPPSWLEPWLQQGNEALNKQLGLVRLLHLAAPAQTRLLAEAIQASYRLLLAVSRVQALGDSHARSQLAAQCQAAALAMQKGAVAQVQAGEAVKYAAELEEVHQALRALAQAPQATPSPAATPKKLSKSFFFADALSNPMYQHFALRTTAAAVICYLIYTALDWQDIHTAMITCYVAALGSTAETLHKLFLRIMGCLMGAALGLASIIWVIPSITSIGGLMVLVFAGIFIAGWVAAGSERTAYVGIQIGLAFLLTVLQGFGPDVQTSVAWDRIIGILLGNGVMFLMFTTLWPVSMMAAVLPRVERVLHQLSHMARAEGDEPPQTQAVSEVLAELHQAREGMALLLFEPRHLRPAQAQVARLQEVIGKASDLCRLGAFQGGRQTPEYAQAVCELPDLLRTVKGMKA